MHRVSYSADLHPAAMFYLSQADFFFQYLNVQISLLEAVAWMNGGLPFTIVRKHMRMVSVVAVFFLNDHYYLLLYISEHLALGRCIQK